MQGTTFGPYTIEELLGRGGMGEVYRAFDTETDREVALKVLPPHLASDAEYLERFRRECRAAAKLREPHIVPIHRFGEIDGRLYLDMRLVEGADLGSWLRDHGPLSPAAAVAVISQVASALDAAHAEGMVHRDVKPSNILLAGVSGDEVDPGAVFAYLFDFGIASSVSDTAEDESTLTRTGTVPGSLAYLAPERFRGTTADRRVDVYALACVLYQSLTGRQPFDGDLATLMHAHLTVEPPPASSTRPDVPTALDQVIARGMAKNPDDRYPTAGALAAAARAAVGSQAVPGAAPPDTTGDARTSTFGTGAPMPRTGPETFVGVPAGFGDPGYGSGYPRAQQGRANGPNPGAPPAGPGYAPVPPTGPPPGRKGKRGRTIAAVVAALVVFGGAGAAAYALSGSGGGRETPSTSTTRPPVVPQTVASVPPATGDPGPSTDQLIADLPVGFTATTCGADDPAARNIGATAYLACENGPSDGPNGATFSRYSQQSALDGGFTAAATAAKVPTVEKGELTVCRDGGSQATTYTRNEKLGGRVGCYKDAATGAAYLFWTDNEALAFGYLRRDDGDTSTLYRWWQGNDFTVAGR
ncbi:serine/threonine-protein kinase [Pseudonocardia sp.]|uniref:serine/threonine-protein kinase n=1 Tax=Pseudonocardia sp. TaxID=60912 RepID=UPI0026258061|nr:serine/threonine-protein kinase [Pseudonocardia sp.]